MVSSVMNEALAKYDDFLVLGLTSMYFVSESKKALSQWLIYIGVLRAFFC